MPTHPQLTELARESYEIWVAQTSPFMSASHRQLVARASGRIHTLRCMRHPRFANRPCAKSRRLVVWGMTVMSARSWSPNAPLTTGAGRVFPSMPKSTSQASLRRRRAERRSAPDQRRWSLQGLEQGGGGSADFLVFQGSGDGWLYLRRASGQDTLAAKNIAQIARLRIISLDNTPSLCYMNS